MRNNAPISAMWHYHFGGKIFCTDGQIGTLTHVLCDANEKYMTGLVLKQGRLFGKTWICPFTLIQGASGDGIRLSCTQTELAGADSVEETNITLDPRTSVAGATGTGRLELVATQPGSGELAYIVARNLVPGRATLVDARYVSELTPGRISVSVDAWLLKSLPPYRPDRELQREVERILFDLNFLHIDLKAVRVRVLDSVLYLDGNISSALRRDLVRDQVAGVEGLLEIKNNLVGDDTLANEIARSLGQDAHTKDLPIGVYPELGVVRLNGSVRNAQQKEAAGTIASRAEGVRGIVNELAIDPEAVMLYVMSPPEKNDPKDLPPGKLIRHTR